MLDHVPDLTYYTVCLRRDVLKNLAKDERWSPGWAYDGRKSMHAPVMFLPQAETSYNVRCTWIDLLLALQLGP